MNGECGDGPTSIFTAATWERAQNDNSAGRKTRAARNRNEKTGSDTAKKISQAQNAGKSYQCPKSDVPAGFLDAVFHEDSV
ncbi:MAG: hypothetical protein KKA91_07335 [Alphaproteobacteria bacterium]|nr:hypothetical protein [Alphaproteobacteria bacterium]MBU4049495.1 hypothetical protein [Alphaproteobacteria bacterium]MBU4154802.1 hypothetical protein [Alphaproteobacteria bacterium]